MGKNSEDNGPLGSMRTDLGLNDPVRVEGHCDGIEQSRIGFCQGLFCKSGTPEVHTTNVVSNLKTVK